ncbi:hypothetical protein JCM8547_006885 [Rhodosporidiobolus lusitaniae]
MNAHEDLTEKFYKNAQPIYVSHPPEVFNDFLCESAYASRERGKRGTAILALSLAPRLHHPNFRRNVVEPFEKLSKKEREQKLLKILAKRARQDAREGRPFDWQFKLVPECTVSNLSSDGALADFFSLLDKYLLNDDFAGNPVPDEGFFRMFGISSEETLPVSPGVRALADNIINSLRKDGESDVDKDSAPTSTSSRSQQSHAGPKTEPLPSFLIEEFKTLDLSERCQWCYRTAKQAGIEKLLFCQKCQNVKRDQPYCSRLCQRTDWTSHKKAAPPRSRRLPNEYWGVAKFGDLQMRGFVAKSTDDPETVRFRRGLRNLAHRALKGDSSCIAVISAIVLIRPWRIAAHPAAAALPYGQSRAKKASNKSVCRYCKELFEFDDEQLKNCIKRGRIEMLKREFTIAKEFHHIMAFGRVDHTEPEPGESSVNETEDDPLWHMSQDVGMANELKPFIKDMLRQFRVGKDI